MTTESYWQIGFNDGYARKPSRPFGESWEDRLAGAGYDNGYRAGMEKREREDYHVPAEATKQCPEGWEVPE